MKRAMSISVDEVSKWHLRQDGSSSARVNNVEEIGSGDTRNATTQRSPSWRANHSVWKEDCICQIAQDALLWSNVTLDSRGDLMSVSQWVCDCLRICESHFCLQFGKFEGFINPHANVPRNWHKGGHGVKGILYNECHLTFCLLLWSFFHFCCYYKGKKFFLWGGGFLLEHYWVLPFSVASGKTWDKVYSCELTKTRTPFRSLHELCTLQFLTYSPCLISCDCVIWRWKRGLWKLRTMSIPQRSSLTIGNRQFIWNTLLVCV